MVAKDKEAPEPERVKPDAVSNTPIPAKSFDELREIVLGGADEIITDPAVIEERLFERMMNASSLEELLRPAEVTKSEDVLGEVLTINDAHFNESDFGDGVGLYAIMDCTISGIQHAVSCGARTVCHQLLVMKHRGWFPARVILHRADKPTKSGYYPMDLTVAPEAEAPF